MRKRKDKHWETLSSPNGLIYFTKTQNQKHKKRKNENLQLSNFTHIFGVFDDFVFKATDENLHMLVARLLS